jgi:hypothetical protein
VLLLSEDINNLNVNFLKNGRNTRFFLSKFVEISLLRLPAAVRLECSNEMKEKIEHCRL